MFFHQCSGLRLRSYAAVGLVLFSIVSKEAFAQNSDKPLSLHHAISKTLAQNLQLHQFDIKKDVLLGRRETSELTSALNISIEVENFAGSGELSGVTSAETTLALSSVIELGGKRRARLSVANAQLQTFDYQRQAFTLDVLGDLTSTFIQALRFKRCQNLL